MELQGVIELPFSKSIVNRELIMAALAGDYEKIEYLNITRVCDDSLVLQEALLRLAPHAKNAKEETYDIGASGTAMRFLTALMAITPGTRILQGSERMHQRPVRLLVGALQRLGARIDYLGQEGFPPLRIIGRELTGSELTLSGSISSQYVSALLMIAPTLEDGLTLHLSGEIISRPYINLTLRLMNEHGIKAAWLTDETIRVPRGKYHSLFRDAESDWSAASYYCEMMALSPDNLAEIFLKGLNPPEKSLQGDSKVISYFQRLGLLEADACEGGILLNRTHKSPITFFNENLVETPDLAQTLVTTCCALEIPFRLTGLQSLRIKETDRIAALVTEMRKLGYVLTASYDSELSWDHQRCPREPRPVIQTYNDHRMAMSFAPLCFEFANLGIADPEVVSKSYPNFWRHLADELGFVIKQKK
jgi:3-phosphoshikimate 1-carboxyvinyltransferase